ncbi:hypothetical protein [Streptomyces lunaelactis]|uniref:hypothetical protein n=1 Tax=Streptomyces lunaelactis TaxID=1535768 RepID=UPI0015847226|nr:hypothetical protein [Streptomyces lunaelactis]NUK17680.1 hypothetical protein [Streptomyces lunaelactis]
MIENDVGIGPATQPGEPTPQTCIRVARQAAELAVGAADEAMNAVIRCRSGNTTRLEDVMHAAHKEACEAEQYANWAEQWEADGVTPYVLARYAARAVDAAVRAQTTAGLEATAAALRTALQRRLTPEEHAERESARRREEARREAEERAATGMDCDNRRRASMNAYFAEDFVPQLGWSAGHVRVLEAAETGRLYRRDGQVRRAPQPGAWSGGRRVSRERTQALLAARFLAAVPRRPRRDGTVVLIPSPMGQVALELARLYPAGLYETDRAAYEARYARVARRGRSREDTKAAARRLPLLDSSALRLYRRPVTLVEQEERAKREAENQWEDEGGYCFGVEMPHPAAEARGESAPAKPQWDAAGPHPSSPGTSRPRQDPPLATPHRCRASSGQGIDSTVRVRTVVSRTRR